MARKKVPLTGTSPAERRASRRLAVIEAPEKARVARRGVRKAKTTKRNVTKKKAAVRYSVKRRAKKVEVKAALVAGDYGPTKAGGVRKNAPGQGRRPTDSRGNTHPYQIHLVPAQMDELRALAAKKGHRNVSRLLAGWTDVGCIGAPKAG